MVTESDIKALLSIGETDASDPDLRLAPLTALAQEMGNAPPDRDAPVREVMARLGDNWSPLILMILATGSFRHATLKRVITAMAHEEDISQRMLTLRLRALERDGFVARSVRTQANSTRVDYTLTPLGMGLVGQLRQLIAWINTHEADIQAARAAFTED